MVWLRGPADCQLYQILEYGIMHVWQFDKSMEVTCTSVVYLKDHMPVDACRLKRTYFQIFANAIDRVLNN